MQKQETYNWLDIASYNVLGEEVYNFSVPTESSIKTITYRLLYEEDGNNKAKEFKIEWYNPNTIVYGFEVTLPEKPVVDGNIIYD